MSTQNNFIHPNLHQDSREIRAANFMRENIKELNRSMESIQKMIEKSRRIISQSRESDYNSGSLQKAKENQKMYAPSPKIKETMHNESIKVSSKTKTVYKQVDFKISDGSNAHNRLASIQFANHKNKNDYRTTFKAQSRRNQNQHEHRSREAILNQTLKLRQKMNSKSKEKEKGSPYKQICDQGRTIYKFSPQKTNNLQFNAHKSLEKNQQKQTHRISSIKNENQQQSKPSNHKENILIEEEQVTDIRESLKRKDLGKEYNFKTQYSHQDSNDVYKMYKIQQPSFNSQSKPQRKKINLKLFDTDAKKSCLASQRTKKSTFESIKISARKNLVKELQQLQTQSASDEQRKAKFILKIKKYGFVEKHLSQQQIWNIYEQLIKSDVPELKWPIVIVDEVYQKMKMSK